MLDLSVGRAARVHSMVRHRFQQLVSKARPCGVVLHLMRTSGMPIPTIHLGASLYSAVLAQHSLVKEVDEGGLAARRTVKKGTECDCLFHMGNALLAVTIKL